MNATQEKIMAVVEANNGEALWQDVVDALDYPERASVMQNVRGLEQSGLAKRNLVLEKGTGTATLSIVKVGG